MSGRARKQGQPLIVLISVIAGWVLMRAAFWDHSFATETPAFASASIGEQLSEVAIDPAQSDAVLPVEPGQEQATGSVSSVSIDEIRAPVLDLPQQELWDAPAIEQQRDVSVATPEEQAETAASHSLLWMAAMAHVPLPKPVQQHFANASDYAGSSEAHPKAAQNQSSRFSVDSWLFFRQDSQAVGTGNFAAPSYGRSQAGAVLRYRLRPQSRFQPQLYARVTQALAGPDDRDVALGLSARPLPGLPVTIHGEARLSEQSGQTEIRPAAFVTTGGEQSGLPLGLKLRGYAQAGYVGGDFATAFADGNLVAEREVAQFDLAKVSAGGGVWGGAQEGAARLDLGPTASVTVKLGEAPARLSVDYRVRVAGDAEPGSGAALTLSTGF